MNSRTSLLHLRDFHPFIHFFSNCGKFVTNSGFEEIVSGKYVFNGWNKTSLIREILQHVLENSKVVAETISRLFQEQYVAPFISEKLAEQSKSDYTTLKTSKEFEEYYWKYVEMQNTGCCMRELLI